MENDEKPSIVLWNYIFDNCKCQYIKSERAYSAFITLCGYDYQEYELDEHELGKETDAMKKKVAQVDAMQQNVMKMFM